MNKPKDLETRLAVRAALREVMKKHQKELDCLHDLARGEPGGNFPTSIAYEMATLVAKHRKEIQNAKTAL